MKKTLDIKKLILLNMPYICLLYTSDDIPEGALQTNPDGSVNTYDADGNKTGTVDAETLKEMTTAVSYTHLDVYKRQSRRRPQQSRTATDGINSHFLKSTSCMKCVR